MKVDDLLAELSMQHKALSIILTNDYIDANNKGTGCALKKLNAALEGNAVLFTEDNLSCPGAPNGYGFREGLPPIKGGFGYFSTCGRGKGYPPGEKIKADINVAENLIFSQPTDVLQGYKYILVKPCEPEDTPHLVTFLANADQLSALIHLYTYRKSDYDSVIAPMSAGCASIFRIPLGESRQKAPRAVIGNVDIFSRPHFPADSFFFTVAYRDFEYMLEDADTCFFTSHIWRGVKNRLNTK